MTFHMEQRHIEMGKRGNCSRCPVALLLAEVTGIDGWRVASVISNDLADLNGYGDLQAAIPANVREFIVSFDRGYWVKPVVFVLPDGFIQAVKDQIPTEVIR